MMTRLEKAHQYAAACGAVFARWQVVDGMMCAVYRNTKEFGRFEITADIGASTGWPEHLHRWACQVPGAVQYVPRYCDDAPYAVMPDGSEVPL